MSLAAAPRPTAAAPAAHGAAPATQAKPVATTAPRAVASAAPAAPTIKGLDKGLIYAVAACTLIAVGLVFWGWYVINQSVTTFNS